MQARFFELADRLFAGLRAGEVSSLTSSAERSSFARLNHARVRQAGEVQQEIVDLTLIRGARHAGASRTLSGDLERDLAQLRASLDELRPLLDVLPDDPHLLYDETPRTVVEEAEDALPSAEDALALVLDAAAGHDLVGLWQSGAQHRGFASSLGHRLFRTSHSFHLGYSLYAQADKAAKGMYAGTRFDEATLRGKLEHAARQVEVLRRPAKRIDPGPYRVYLAPGALAEIVELVGSVGFGVKAHRTKQTPLLRMLGGETALASNVSFSEEAAEGVAPPFLAGGFLRPSRVDSSSRAAVSRARWSRRARPANSTWRSTRAPVSARARSAWRQES